MARSARYELGVGVLMAVAIVLLGWMALKVGSWGALGERVDVSVRTTDAAGVQQGAHVLVAGVRVGEVSGVELDGGVARIRLALDPAAGLRRDVAVRVRARSILGEKYVELVPGLGNAPLLADGDELVVEREQVEIDELVDAVGPLLAAVDVEGFGASVAAVSGALKEDPERVARMLRNADAILADGAEAAGRLSGLLDRADAALARVEDAAAALQRRLDEAASPIARADAILADVQEAGLAEVADEARAALAEIRGVAARADGVLAEVDGIGPDLKRVLANVAGIDKWEIRRLLREEGILIRTRPAVVVEAGGGE